MKNEIKALAVRMRGAFDENCRRVAVGSGLMALSVSAMADDTVDVSDTLLKIAAGLAAALLVSAAMTAAVLGVKASKLPRRGG